VAPVACERQHGSRVRNRASKALRAGSDCCRGGSRAFKRATNSWSSRSASCFFRIWAKSGILPTVVGRAPIRCVGWTGMVACSACWSAACCGQRPRQSILGTMGTEGMGGCAEVLVAWSGCAEVLVAWSGCAKVTCFSRSGGSSPCRIW
jgi:hypothetical protein